jgi:iron complex outermembrane recepter protein
LIHSDHNVSRPKVYFQRTTKPPEETRMSFTRKPVAAAVALSVLPLLALAQTQSPAAADGTQTIEVTGIRASILKSIATKRDAPTSVEVITAEDVGKLPDKNIADALSRLPGLNVQFGGALAMDEAERIAIRGTSPNLNLTTINGHALSSGDWHVGDQGSSGRSVGFGLMPSQLIGRAIVYKTGQADITEGGIAGTVDIQTRKPLDFRQTLTGEVAVGAVYADMPRTTDPQLSALVSWRSDAGTFGVLVQAFSEKRHLRRDGQEVFGAIYRVSTTTAAASGDPSLAGLRVPNVLNSALFEGVRERTGGYVGVQFKPTPALDLNLSGFHVTLDADNYNSSAFALPSTLLNNGWLIRNARVEGDVLLSASLERPAPSAGNANQRVIGLQFDHNQRKGASSLSSFYDFDFKWKPSDKLAFDGRVGYTKGEGKTNTQPSLTFGLVNPNVSYSINTTRPTDYRITDPITGAPIDLSRTSSYVQMSNVGASVKSSDEERYLHLNGQWNLDGDVFSKIKFGLRTAKHERQYDVIGVRWNAQDVNGVPVSPSPFFGAAPGPLVTGGVLVNFQNLPVYPGTTVPTQQPIVPNGQIPVPATAYPGDYASGLDANFPRNLFRFTPEQISAFAAQYVNWDPVRNKAWGSGYTVEETNNAAYVMTEFDQDSFSGNAGLRVAQTQVYSLAYQTLTNGAPFDANGRPTGNCVPLQPCPLPGAIVGAVAASFLPQVTQTTHTALLPSLNIRYTLQGGLIGRFSISRTLGRPNYNELASAVSLNNTTFIGTSGNPLLKPITSTNIDASLAWYFAPQAYVQAAVFAQSLRDYVKVGTSQVEFFNTATQANAIYTVTSRIGVDASISGLELAVEMPLGRGFGVSLNGTLVDGRDQDGVELLGTSRATYNAQLWFENETIGARLAWNHRSDYAIGFLGNGTNTPGNGLHKYKGSGSLSMSLAYRFSRNISLTLDGNNLLNPVRSTYYNTGNSPANWHESGRQFYLNLRAKF